MGTVENAPLRRSRSGRVVSGVCAGIAGRLQVDPLVVRALAVVLGIVSGGAAVPVYLLAWALIPDDGGIAPPPAAQPPAGRTAGPPGGGAREEWAAAGAELRSLAAQLRPAPPGPTPDAAPPGPVSRPRATLDAVDATMTAVGERLRDPAVQATARRAAQRASAAVAAGATGIGRRVSRAGGDGPPRGPDPT